MRTSISALALLLLLSACGPKANVGATAAAPSHARAKKKPRKDRDPFPTAKELESMAALPVPAAKKGHEVADVESWKMVGPGRSVVDGALYAGTEPWDAAITNAGIHATESLHCVAREVAAFGLAWGKDPDDDLVAWLSARCGADLAQVSVSVQVQAQKSMPPKTEIARVINADAARVLKGFDEAGLAVDYRKGKLAICFVGGRQEAVVEPFSLIPQKDGTVRVKGYVQHVSPFVLAMVNRGAFDVSECTPAAGANPPAFDVTCRPSFSDDQAWLELASTEPTSHRLVHTVFRTLVFPAGKVVDEYHRPVVAAKGDLDELAVVNSVRDAMNLGRLHSAPDEESVMNKLAPLYFASSMENDIDTTEKIARGLMAGWTLGEPVLYGATVSDIRSSAATAQRAMGAVLQYPTGRTILLDPAATRASFAVNQSVIEGGRATLACVWAPPDSAPPEIRANAVLSAVGRERRERGRGAPERIGKELDGDVAKVVHDIETDHVDAEDALDELMKTIVKRARRSVRGYVVHVRSLDRLVVPDNIADAPFLYMEVAVAVQPPDESSPWGDYVVAIAFIDQ